MINIKKEKIFISFISLKIVMLVFENSLLW
jgi:hypothetical protein